MDWHLCSPVAPEMALHWLKLEKDCGLGYKKTMWLSLGKDHGHG